MNKILYINSCVKTFVAISPNKVLISMINAVSLFGALRASDVQSSGNARAAKISSVSVPQEYDLIRLIQNVQNRHPSWDTNTPAGAWAGVVCDERNQATHITWSNYKLSSLVWKYLPSSLLTLHVLSSELCGELPFVLFPPSLEVINLYNNKLTGNLDLLRLPPLLENLDVEKNMFFGVVDFSSLPSTLADVKLSRNSELKGVFDVALHSPNLTYDFRQTNITVSNGCLFRECSDDDNDPVFDFAVFD